MNGIYQKEFEVHVDDIDKNGNMKLTSYLKIMQEIGALHSKVYGFGIDDEPITHKAWIIISWKINILKRPTWNEKLSVKTWIGKMDKLYYYRDFEITDDENNLVAKAVSKWVMVDTISKKIQKIDEHYLNKFIIVDNVDYDNNIKKVDSKININNSSEVYNYKISKRDIDTNNHMNNVIYLELAEEIVEEEFWNNISYIEIHYKSECKYGDNIAFVNNKTNVENKVYVMDSNKEKLHTLIMLK